MMRTRRLLAVLMVVLLVGGVVAGVSVGSGPVGSGPAGLAVWDPTTGQWHLRYPNGVIDRFYYGAPGDTPLLGDWDCDGIDTVAMYRRANGFIYLRNSNVFGTAERDFFYGLADDVPLAGDWDGDGCDTFAIYRPTEGKVYVRNSLGTGMADYSFYYGIPGDKPFAGDFDGDRISTVGLYRDTTGFVYFRNTLTTGNADLSFFYGVPSDRIIVGDWDGNETDTVGIYRSSERRFYLSNENAQKKADLEVVFGQTGWLPVAGRFLQVSPTTITTKATIPMPTTPPPPLQVLYRVNAGGPQVEAMDGGPVWEADFNTAPSGYVNIPPTSGVVTHPVTVPLLDATVPSTTPSAVFQWERWDEDAPPEMVWHFPVVPTSSVEVRLYFASTYEGAAEVGQRKFDVVIDNTVVLNNFDIVADAGHQVGTMRKFTVTADGDGLHVGFFHLIQAPQISAIEILGTGTPAPTTTTTSTTTTTKPPVPGTPPFTLPYRVNAGGPAVAAMDGGPLWAEDTITNPSPYVNYQAGDWGNRTTNWAIPTFDASVPATIPLSLFQAERWSPDANNEMRWNFPIVQNTLVEVRLYFSAGYPGASLPGQRQFDVYLDGTLVLDNYDAVADVGYRKGVMKRWTIAADANGLDIQLVHTDPPLDNPQINAIEILPVTGRTVRVSEIRTPVKNYGFYGPSLSAPDNGVALQIALGSIAKQGPSPSSRWTLTLEPTAYDLDSGQLTMIPWVDIVGSGPDTTTLWGDRGPGTESLPGAAIVIGADNASLSDVTIDMSAADLYNAHGILNDHASPTFANLRINVRARREAWGIQNVASSPTITKVTIALVAADFLAVGVENTGGSAPIMQDVVADARYASYGSSNGMRNVDSAPTIIGGSFTAEGASAYGIHNSNSKVTIQGSTLVATSSGSAFGIYNTTTAPTGPLATVVEGATIIGASGTIRNDIYHTVSAVNSILYGGPVTGSGVTCTNVWDENGAFYPNTCP